MSRIWISSWNSKQWFGQSSADTFFDTGSHVRQQKLWLSSHTSSRLGAEFVKQICSRGGGVRLGFRDEELENRGLGWG